MLVCLFVTNKRLNRSGQNFVWDLTWPLGRFMNGSNFESLCFKVYIFVVKFWKCAKKYFEILKLFFVLRRCLQIKPQFKVTIEDGRRFVFNKWLDTLFIVRSFQDRRIIFTRGLFNFRVLYIVSSCKGNCVGGEFRTCCAWKLMSRGGGALKWQT